MNKGRCQTPTADGAVADLDRLFDVLASRYRRRILSLLQDSSLQVDEGLSIAEIAMDDDDHPRLEHELYHVHLPKLADAGYVDWDPEEDRIQPGPAFEAIEPVIGDLRSRASRHPLDWP